MSTEYVYGKNACLSLIKNRDNFLNVFIQKNYLDKKIISELEKKHIKYKYVERKVLDNLTNDGLHQGIVIEIEGYDYLSIDELLEKIKDVKNPLLLMLDGIEDPHNLGAILRSVDAINAQGVIIGKHNQVPLNSTVAKVSTGAIEYVNVAQVTNLTNTIKYLKEKGYWIVGAEANESVDFNTLKYDFPTLLVVGSEGKGISNLVLKQCDYRVKIPMEGHVNSLNVSVATAVLLYGIYLNRKK